MSFTQVSGTILDPNGLPYSGAKLSARLVSTNTPRFGSQLVDAYAALVLDKDGAFSLQLADNATVTPASSTWTFQVDIDGSAIQPPIGTGPQSFVVAGITITGATQDLSATLSAAAPALARVISSGTSGGGTIGPSAGHNTLVGVPAVLEIIADTIGVAPLLLENTALPGAYMAVNFDGTGNNSYITLTDGIAGGFIEFGSVGGVSALQFQFGKLSFFNQTPVAQQAIDGGYGGNSALQSLLNALGLNGLVTGGTLTDGQDLIANGAITPDVGCVVISKGSGIALATLAVPTTNFQVLRITCISAFAHQITGPAAGFNAAGAGGDVLTFTTAAIGDSVTLLGYSGVWYIIASRGTITLS